MRPETPSASSGSASHWSPKQITIGGPTAAAVARTGAYHVCRTAPVLRDDLHGAFDKRPTDCPGPLRGPVHWRRLGLATFSPCYGIEFEGVDDKDASMFPVAIPDPSGQPSMAIIHRPLFTGTRPEETVTFSASRELDLHRESIWISYCPVATAGTESPRLGRFTSHHRIASPVAPWERLKIGGGTPPVLTRHGWLVIYHGVCDLAEPSSERSHLRYSAGVLMLSERIRVLGIVSFTRKPPPSELTVWWKGRPPVVDWIRPRSPPARRASPMNTLSLRTWIRNAAAVFSGCYGAVTRQAEQAGCSRQTVYDHARQVEQRLQPAGPRQLRAEVGGSASPTPAPRPSARRAHPATPGGHRLRHGHQHPSDRRPAPRHPPRGRPRSLDHRPLGRRRGQEGQARPGDARRGVHPPGPDARAGRDLFWGRPTLVGIEPASMTAVFCDNAADRKAETWEEQLTPFDRLEFAVSDAAKGIAKAVVGQVARGAAATTRRPRPWSMAWTSSTPRWRPNASWPEHWRRAESAWEKAEAADVEVARSKTARHRRPGRGPDRPRRLEPGDRVVGADRAPGSGLAPGPRRAGPVRCRRPAQRPRPRRGRDRRGAEGPDRPGVVEGPQLPASTRGA